MLRSQIDRSIFAATIDFDIELQTITFIEVGHACAFDGADVNEGVGLSVIALNEAEALHRVEELHRAGATLASQLTLRRTAAIATTETAGAASRTFAALARRAAIFHRHWFAIDLKIGCGHAATTIDQSELKRLTFGQAGEARLLDSTDMHKHIFAAIIADDETEALLAVEEFDDAFAFADDLGWHTAATTAATATARAAETATGGPGRSKAATTAAAEAITTAAAETIATTAAKAIAATAEAITAATEIIVAEAVALVSATPTALSAASSIETHALLVFPGSPIIHSEPACRAMDTDALARKPNAP